MELLDYGIRYENKIKILNIRKEFVVVLLFVYDIIIKLENLRELIVRY